MLGHAVGRCSWGEEEIQSGFKETKTREAAFETRRLRDRPEAGRAYKEPRLKARAGTFERSVGRAKGSLATWGRGAVG